MAEHTEYMNELMEGKIDPATAMRNGMPSLPPRPPMESNFVPTNTAAAAFGTPATPALFSSVGTPAHLFAVACRR